MNFQEVPYVKLSAKQNKKALEVLGRGNLLLKKWSAFLPSKKFGHFRNAVLDGNNNPKYDGNHIIPADRLKEFQSDLPFITAIRNDKYDDLGGRSAEQAILEGFTALACKFAKLWSKEGDPVGLTIQDFKQEAHMKVVEAMYLWNPELKVEISTYIWCALKNRMSNVVNQAKMFGAFTNADLAIISRFEKKRRLLPTYFTFDDIVSELELSVKEIKHLSSLMIYVSSESQFPFPTSDDCERDDYTANRSGADELETDIVEQIEQVSFVLIESNLTSLERELIELAMNPYNGWQTEFAKTHINPSTNKPYSRMRITQVLQMAREKVASTLNRQAA